MSYVNRKAAHQRSHAIILPHFKEVIIDREARELMYLVASVRPSVCPSVRYHSHA